MALALRQKPLSISKEGVVCWQAVRLPKGRSTNSFTSSDCNLGLLNFIAQGFQLLLSSTGVYELGCVEQFKEFTSSPKETADNTENHGHSALPGGVEVIERRTAISTAEPTATIPALGSFKKFTQSVAASTPKTARSAEAR
jgi:hypothetical protein